MNTLSSTIEKNTEDTDLSRSYTVIQGPMKEKIPPSLVISYTTLRVLNPIGQGMLIQRREKGLVSCGKSLV